MYSVKISGSRVPRVSFHEEDCVPIEPTPGFGASQYGMVWFKVSNGRATARPSFSEGDFPQLGQIAPTGIHYIPVWRRRRR